MRSAPWTHSSQPASLSCPTDEMHRKKGPNLKATRTDWGRSTHPLLGAGLCGTYRCASDDGILIRESPKQQRTVGNDAAHAATVWLLNPALWTQRAVPPGLFYSPSCTPETESGIGGPGAFTPYHTRLFPRSLSKLLPILARVLYEFLVTSRTYVCTIQQAACFFLDRRGCAIVLMVRMVAPEVSKPCA